jgi:Tfp pilus assembly protein PilN
MIEINLLPKEFRKKSAALSISKKGYYALGAVAGLIVMVIVISLYQNFQLRELDKKMEIAHFRTQQLQKDIAVVDALTEVKEKIMQRMEAVDRLDRHRTTWVRVLEDVTRRVPEFTWISLIEEAAEKKAEQKATVNQGNQKENQPDTTAAVPVDPNVRPIKIEGYSFTLNSLATFMIKLMRSNFFSDVEMVSVEEVVFDEHKAYNYKLAANLHYLSDKELKELLEAESGSDLLASY